MKELYELKEKLTDELKNYGKKDLSASTLGTVKNGLEFYICILLRLQMN